MKNASLILILTCVLFGCGVNREASFEDDPAIIGRWETVDFVRNIEDFNPEKKMFNDAVAVKEFVFKPNGITHMPFWTWSKGEVYHSDDKTTAHYKMRTIDGVQYLFLEWMSGDVTMRGMEPQYYVFKKGK